MGREAGRWIWENKHRFVCDVASDGAARAGQDPLTALDIHTAASAVAAAKAWASRQAGDAAASSGPVCINETADNTGCGAPGDASHGRTGI